MLKIQIKKGPKDTIAFILYSTKIKINVFIEDTFYDPF